MAETLQEEDTSTLAYLGWVLQESGFETRFIEADESPDHPYEQLLIQAAQTPKAQDLMLRLVLAEDIMQALNKVVKKPSLKTYSGILQCTLWLPGLNRSVSDALLPALDQVLNVINEQMDFGCASYNSQDGIHLRHSLVLAYDAPDPRPVAEVVGRLGVMGVRYLLHLQALVAQKAPVEVILKKIQNIGQEA